GRAAGANRSEGLPGVGRLAPHLVGRELDDAQDGAAGRRLELDPAGRGVLAAAVGGGRGLGAPQVGERYARHRRHAEHVRRLAVLDEDRLAGPVVAGDDAADAVNHSSSPQSGNFLTRISQEFTTRWETS